LELRDIEYFGVIAEHRHLGRAAEALGLSIPAVSKSLRRLEASTQSKLVERTPKGVELTPEGAALLSHVRGLRVSLRDITRQLSDLRHGRTGDIHVGAALGYAEFLLPKACAALMDAGARVTVTVMVSSRSMILPALQHGELDLAITEPPGPGESGFAHEHLYDNQVVVASALDHPLAREAELLLADLVAERWAVPSALGQRQLHDIFERHGLPPPDIALITNSSWLRVRTIASSRLLGMYSRPTYPESESRLKVLPVNDLRWNRSVSAVYRESAYLSPAARKLIDVLKEVAPHAATNSAAGSR